MLDQLTKLLAGTHPAILITGAVLVLLILTAIALKIRSIVQAEKPSNKLVGIVTFVGMIWSGDVVWELTGRAHFTLGLRVAVFAVLEVMLLVAMLRTKESIKAHGHAGPHGTTAWLIASTMALVAFAVGVFVDHSAAMAVFRPVIPLMLTKLWWDGVGATRRPRGAFKWTPRNLLLWMGAIEADERDIETVNRQRLVQQMVEAHRRWNNATEGGRKDRIEAKLIKLSEKADDSVIDEVRDKRGRSNWFKSVPLAQHPSAHDLAQLAQELAQRSAQSAAHDPAQPRAGRSAALEVPAAHRAKTSAQATTGKNDAVAQAAQLVISGEIESVRAAAKATGAAPSSVRDRVQRMRDETPDRAPESAHSAHPQINGHPVTAGSEN